MTTAEKLTTIAENQQRVYEAGQKSEYDRFWDAYQQNGKRRLYNAAFAGHGWTNETFKPKYDIVALNGASLFINNLKFSGDLAAHLENLGITLDLSAATTVISCFEGCKLIERLPEINISSAGTLSRLVFSQCEVLHTIDAFVVAETNVFTNTFQKCYALQHLIIKGVIANDINLSDCPLTRESILSVLSALSVTATGKTATFKKTAVNAAFSTEEWDELAATKPNWRIDLV